MTMNADERKEAIRAVLGPLSQAKGIELTDETELALDLDLDSMKIMEVLGELEERLDVSIPLNILPNMKTLADLDRELVRLTDS